MLTISSVSKLIIILGASLIGISYFETLFDTGNGASIKEFWDQSLTNLPSHEVFWRVHFGRKPSHVNCSAFFKGDERARRYYVNVGRVVFEKERELPMNCDAVRQRIMGNSQYPKVNYTYAVARNIFQEYRTQELYLSISYSTMNAYCFALDKKMSLFSRQQIEKLSECLPNVVLAKNTYEFTSGGHFQDIAHYDCVKELMKYKWDYVMLLQSNDVIIKSNQELSEIMSFLNGTSIVGSDKVLQNRLPKTPLKVSDIKLFKNGSFNSTISEKTLDIHKSPNQVFLSRTFLEGLYKKYDITTLLDIFNNRQVYGIDEFVSSTLVYSNFLGLPNQLKSNCSQTHAFRYVQWNFGNALKCASGKNRHNVCMLGVEYLPIFEKTIHLIANKVWQDFDVATALCLSEWSYNKSHGIIKNTFNKKVYSKVSWCN